MGDRRVRLHLETPPEVVNVGVGVHGLRARDERWVLPELHSVHLYGYHADVAVDGEVHAIQPGALSIVAAGSVMEYRYRGRSEHVYAHLRLPRTGRTVSAPVMQVLDDAAAVRARLLAVLVAPAAHRSAELWSLLWRAAGGQEAPTTDGPESRHPAVATAVAMIEANLADTIGVDEVARAAHVSASHLTRLFRATFGIGVATYVRRRRSHRIEHLLGETTQSIGSIAASVGFTDLQNFNKFCRAQLGASPRQVRERGSP